MRGHSLAELTEHDDSAADIIVHSTICTYMLRYLCAMTVIDSRVCASRTVSFRRGLQRAQLLRRTGFQLHQKRRFFPSELGFVG